MKAWWMGVLLALAGSVSAQGAGVDVATFSPSMWGQGNGSTPWTPIGKSESKAYFYTFAAMDYQAFIVIKSATRGPGDDYILIEFAEARLDCRPNQPYPSELVTPTVYSYSGDGNFNADTQRLPGNIPVEHGTVLAKAVVGTCDAVRAHAGTVLAH